MVPEEVAIKVCPGCGHQTPEEICSACVSYASTDHPSGCSKCDIQLAKAKGVCAKCGHKLG